MSDERPRVWYWPPWRLTAPILGVPGCRPPVWRGGDEFGRRTLVIQLPLLGALIIAIGPVHDQGGEHDAS